MKIRKLEAKDIPRLEEIYRASGFDYDFPDLDAAQFLVKQVVVDENDEVRIAVACRQTVELYSLFDSTWNISPRWRFEAFRRLHESVRCALVNLGIEDAHCWLPGQIAKSFARRLKSSFGYRENRWTCLSRGTARTGMDSNLESEG